MKIIHLPSSSLPEKIGGTEVYVDALANLQAKDGWHPIVLTFGEKNSRKNYGLYELVVLSAKPAVAASDLHGKISKDVRAFERFLQEETPDAVHFHAFTTGAGISHARICSERRIPYFITYHVASMSCPRGNLMYQGIEICNGVCTSEKFKSCIGYMRSFVTTLLSNNTEKRFQSHSSAVKEFFDNASHTIATAKWVKDLLVTNGLKADKITVLRQGFPSDKGSFSLRVLPKRDLRVGYLGRISDDKGIERFLDLAVASQVDRLDLSWNIVGYPDGISGNINHKFKTAVRSKAVSYLGRLSGSSLENFLATTDILVIPSICPETGPLTLLEAWKHGTWVIGSGHSGIQEFFKSVGLEFCGMSEWSMPNFLAVIQQIKDFQSKTEGALARVYEISTADSVMSQLKSIYLNIVK